MKIIEHTNKKIVLKGAHNPNDDEKHSCAEPLPNWNFASMLIGGAGSGKTSLLVNMLSSKKWKSYRGCFDRIYFFSASLHTLPDDFTMLLSPSRTFQDAEKLPAILQEEKDAREGKVLFVFDDMVREMKQYEPVIKQLIFNRRHYAGGASVFIVSQKLTSIPLSIRSGMDSIYFFGISAKNKKERTALFDDFITGMEKDDFEDLMKYVFKDGPPHRFLFIDKRNDKYYKEFNELEIDE